MAGKGMQVRVVGIPWYARKDYARVFAVMDDIHLLPDTWEEWFKAAKNLRDGLRKEGVIVEQVHLDPDSFAAWCAARRLNVDAKARTAFANEEAHRKFGSTH